VDAEGWEFPEFFMSQYGRLRRLGFLLTGDWAQGEELAQETLVTVYRRWALVRSKEFPEAYARKVLVNRHRSLLRRLRLEALHARRNRAGAELTNQGSGTARADELLAARAAIRRLPARQRAVVVLRYHEDLSEREVAQLLGIPLGTVKSTSSRALARLRRELSASTADHPATERGRGSR
jgi:RNA polymerase sigma-70 factor (sigma-E family)